jgi:hypothetical protein
MTDLDIPRADLSFLIDAMMCISLVNICEHTLDVGVSSTADLKINSL